ncbi:hypothetical protein NE562_04445 [Butyricicoccus faecihominis]|uniref:hypothetical protein n=1 Tax=Butyricicoccus faecihominis TaxID=1712515 RepID=UPI00247A3A60|nr:hypothetical protein [Butyricicoccus faecihominis]MCQ5128898.1 hypothetical protein [Butyricicoccus faecihominis]
MILYLSSTQHTNLLDFTGRYDPDSDMPIKKLVGSYMLKQFVVHDMRNFSHFTDVVLDRLAFGDDDTEFAEAIEEFLTMYHARVTVICEGLTPVDPLFQALLDSGVGNIVCDTEIAAIQQEITECLSETGMTRYNPKERPAPAGGVKYRFDCQNIRITVVGSQPRIGVTTAAISLCHWLQSVGATVCYVEDNESRILPILARSYGMEQDGDGWRFEGVQYRRQEPETPVNFIVRDMGSEEAPPQDTDLLVLLCGTKAWELPHTAKLKRTQDGNHAYLLCPFVLEDSRADVAEALQDDYHKVLFLDYQPEPTDGTANAKQFKMMITKYIAGA